MKSNFLKYAGALMLPALLFSSCKKEEEQTTTPPAEQTIYQDLGGSEMVSDPNNPGQMIQQGYLTLRSVVDSTIFVIAADNDLNGYFGPLLAEVGSGDLSGFASLSASLTNFFAVATGGSFTYNGQSMAAAHKVGTNNRNQFLVNNVAFDNFVGAVVAGAGKNGVPSNAPVIARIGGLLETLRGDIVQTENTIAEQTLYDELGGSSMVADPNNQGQMIEAGYLTLRSVVDSTIFVIAGDDRLNNEYFSVLLNEVGSGDLSGFTALSKDLTDFFAYSTGSTNPDHYYNKLNMVDAHNPAINNRMGAKADNAAYNAFVEDVVIGAEKNGVPSSSPIVAALGAFLETLRGDVVQR